MTRSDSTSSIEPLTSAVVAGDRAALARAITLVESTRADHQAAARELLRSLPEPREPAWRVAISGVPGAGKSTLIEALGTLLTGRGRRVGVLAIDPSSVRTGGSVLGDKTRMPRLAADPAAYIRPSPSAGTLGGVARATAQTIPLLEAAGFDVILVETVGVGQSETTAASMVDTFLLLGLARSGDQLQGIKRGVLEIADVIAINKADGEGAVPAKAAARELASAMRLMRGTGPMVPVPAGEPAPKPAPKPVPVPISGSAAGPTPGPGPAGQARASGAAPAGSTWTVPVVTCSAETGDGIPELWDLVGAHRTALGDTGIAAKRSAQRWELTGSLVIDAVLARLAASTSARAARERLRPEVLAGAVSPVAAADEILAAFDSGQP